MLDRIFFSVMGIIAIVSVYQCIHLMIQVYGLTHQLNDDDMPDEDDAIDPDDITEMLKRNLA